MKESLVGWPIIFFLFLQIVFSNSTDACLDDLYIRIGVFPDYGMNDYLIDIYQSREMVVRKGEIHGDFPFSVENNSIGNIIEKQKKNIPFEVFEEIKAKARGLPYWKPVKEGEGVLGGYGKIAFFYRGDIYWWYYQSIIPPEAQELVDIILGQSPIFIDWFGEEE